MNQIINFIFDTNSKAVLNIDFFNTEITEFVKIMEERGFIVKFIQSCKSKEEVLNNFASEFNFPNYFGNNWDSLVDCLTNEDMEIAEGYLVIIKIQLQNDNDKETMLKVFDQISLRWKKFGIQFKFLLLET